MNVLLAIVTALMMWGPPRLRPNPRPLSTALESPFDLDGFALFQVVVWVGAAILLAIILGARGLWARRLFPRVLWKSSLKLYLIYGLLAAASAWYSVSPVYTLFFACKIMVAILSAALFVDQGDLSQTFPKILKLYLGVQLGQLILNIAVLAIDPSLIGSEVPGIGYRLAGGIFEDYGISAAMAGLFFLCCALFRSRGLLRAIYWSLYFVSWIFLALSRTRSSIVGGVVILVFTLAVYKSPNIRILSGVIAGLFCSILIATQSIDPLIAFGMRGQSFDALVTLTGRTNAFEFLLQQWREAPWLGYGYGAGSRYLLMRFVRESGLGIGAAHDAASKVLAELGGVGTALLLLIVLLTWIEMIRLVRSSRPYPELQPLATASFVLLSFFTLINLVSAGVAEVSYPFLVIAVCAAVLRERIAVRAASTRRMVIERTFREVVTQ